jgi:hypothetical protein
VGIFGFAARPPGPRSRLIFGLIPSAGRRLSAAILRERLIYPRQSRLGKRRVRTRARTAVAREAAAVVEGDGRGNEVSTTYGSGWARFGSARNGFAGWLSRPPTLSTG